MNALSRAPRQVRGKILGHRARVVELDEISPRLRRIVLLAPDLAGTPPPDRPAPWLTLQVGALRNPRDFKRTYTVSRHEPDGTVELLALAHGDGPGSALVHGLAVGDEVVVRGPEGGLALDPTADYHLVTGDETAIASVAGIARALEPGALLVVRLQAARPAAVEALGAALPVRHLRADVAWIEDGTPERLAGAVAASALPDGRGAALLLGELRSIRSVRTHLRSDRGWERRQIVTKPYWTPGRTGLD